MQKIPNPPRLGKLDRAVIAVLVCEELGFRELRYRITKDQFMTVQFLIESDPIRWAYHLRLAAQIRVLGKRADAKR